LLGIIRRDTHIKETIRAQTPLLIRFPNSQAAQDLDHIAQSFFKKG
jgi:flagellar biosynthesis protein FlhG